MSERTVSGLLTALLLGLMPTLTSAADLLERALQQRAQGELAGAVTHLRNISEDAPIYARGQLLLGRLLLRLGQVREAEQALRRAGRLGADSDWQYLLGEALLAQGRFGDLERETRTAPGDQPAHAARLLGLQSRALRAQDRAADADHRLAEAQALMPLSPAVQLEQARTALHKQKPDEALAQARAIVAQHPAHSESWLFQAELLRHLRRWPEALKAYARCLELSPGEPSALLGEASILVSQQDFAKARSVNNQLLRQLPDLPVANYLSAVLALQNKQPDRAAVAVRRALRVDPGHLPSHLLLGSILHDQGKYAEAEGYLQRFVDQQPGHIPATKLLAAAQLKQNKYPAAIRLLQPLAVKEARDAQILAMLGSAQLRNGNASAGLGNLRRAAELAPDLATIQAELGLGELSSGHHGPAERALASAQRLAPDLYQADLFLILTHLQAGAGDKALQAATAFLDKQPDSALAHHLLGVVHLSMNQTNKGREYLNQALRLDPHLLEARLVSAKLALAEGQQEAASRHLELILKQNPDHAETLWLKAGMARSAGDPALLRDTLQQLLRAQPKHRQAQLALASLNLEQGRLEQADELSRALMEQYPQRPEVHKLAGLLAARHGRLDKAIRHFQEMAKRQPESTEAAMLLAMAYLQNAQAGPALEYLDRVLGLQPNHIKALRARISLALQQGRHKPAEVDARHWLELEPDQLLAEQAVGLALLGQGLTEAALRHLRKAAAEGLDRGLSLNLYLAERRAGDANAAFAVLEEFLAGQPDDHGIRAQLAGGLLADGQTERAIQHYEQLLEARPNDAVALNNLSWLYFERDDKRGRELAERAYELKPGSPEIADTLGWILLHSGAPDRGLVILKEAAMQARAMATVRYHLAVAESRTGDVDAARRILSELLESKDPFPERAEAEQLSRTLAP